MKIENYFKSGISAALISVALAACGSDNKNNAATPPPQQPGNTREVTINIASDAMDLGSAAFGQNPLTIDVGTKVNWINQDTVSHTITSFTGAFDSGTLAAGQTFSFTFNDPGTFNYYCQIHPTMTGQIVVTPAGTPSPTPTGSTGPTPTPTPSSSPSPSPSPSPSATP